MERREKGFALLEIVVALAILGVIMPVIAMTTTTILTNHQQSVDQNIVLDEVQNVGYWMSRDIQMAKNVTLTAPGGFPSTLDIPVDTDENHDISIDYLFDGNQLKRQVYDSSETLILETLIAKYIDAIDTTISTLDSKSYELTVKASRGEVVVERSYEVRRRLSD